MMTMKHPSTTVAMSAAASLLAVSFGVGCAAPQRAQQGGAGDRAPLAEPEVVLTTDAAASARVFDAARDTLMGYRFALDRVDARRGVITTHPKRTTGLATPWDREQSHGHQEWEDLLNEQRRVVRLVFERDGAEAGAPFARVRIRVEVLRTNRPNWRIETESPMLSSHALSRDRNGDLEPASFSEVVGLDVSFAQRIADEMKQRLTQEDEPPIDES